MIRNLDELLDKVMAELGEGEHSVEDIVRKMGLDPDTFTELDWAQFTISLNRHRTDVYHPKPDSSEGE